MVHKDSSALRPRNHLFCWSAQPREPAPMPGAQGPSFRPAGSVRSDWWLRPGGEMSTFQRRGLGEGAGSCPSEAQNSGPSSACLQELERPQQRPGQCHRRAQRRCQANVKSLPVAPSLWLRSAGVDRLRSLGSGDPLLKHSHRVPLCSPCASRCSPLPWLRAGLPGAFGFEFYWAPADLGPGVAPRCT